MRKSLYLKILVPLDGSKYSEKALIHACELTKTFQAELLLLYVIDKSPSLNLLDRREYLKIIRNFGKKVLKKSEKITLEKGIDSKQIIKEGHVVNEIINLAKKEKCNLIVVGNKGLGTAARFFLGSVSNKLANNSPCSILIVK